MISEEKSLREFRSPGLTTVSETEIVEDLILGGEL